MMRPPKPSDDDILQACEWLDNNEGDADESDPMKRVAEWLRYEVNQRAINNAVRRISREAGVSRARAREALLKRD